MNEIELMQIKDFVKDMDKNQRIVYYEQKKKSVGIAVLLSFIIPGAGQMYLGRVGKGIILLLTCWLIIPWIYSIYDAYKSAKDYNAQLYSIIFSKDD
ncbi:TPA: TM2 domain-containing protein [Methanocaldococcus jannaschii]|nr:TM2 domain-containing protein [Methanocaldococcus jannaschii]HII59151.1 TM2 domain-containing protein [Methanocaldococcus jannaschii]